MKKQKGYVLLITIIVVAVLSIMTITAMSIVYRYTSATRKRIDELRENVNPTIVEGEVAYVFDFGDF